ncbi:MAG TPA: hypothetical protein VMW23_01640 [Sedimentisphaerales bacterium]|nr:hypothetical protein [Sedimentisphaerales bacterium]
MQRTTIAFVPEKCRNFVIIKIPFAIGFAAPAGTGIKAFAALYCTFANVVCPQKKRCNCLIYTFLTSFCTVPARSTDALFCPARAFIQHAAALFTGSFF